MNSLKEVYGSLQEQDLVKEATARASQQYGVDMSDFNPDLVKVAQDYDLIGRRYAHTVMAELVKEAMEEEMPDASSEEKKKTLEETMAMARGEKKPPKKEDSEKGEESEKKASIRDAILERMAEDPSYVSALVAKYYG